MVFGANPGLAHGLADQRGFGRQDHLRRADLLGVVDEVVSDLAERSRFELQRIPQLVAALLGGVHIGEQDIDGNQRYNWTKNQRSWFVTRPCSLRLKTIT